MQRKIITQYYVLSGLLVYCGLSLTSAVYVTFLLKNGLSLMEANLVNAAFFLTLFVCEIPTGAFADIFGRKTSFVVACFLFALGKYVYALSSTMSFFIMAEMIIAVAYTFQNGAFQAWFVDSMKHHGYNGSFTVIFGRLSLICQICSVLGAITGSYLYAINSTLPWFAGAILLVVLMLVAYRIMNEEYFKKVRFSFKQGMDSMRDTAVKSIQYGMNHKSVRFVLIITFVQILAVMPLNMYWQPFFKGKGMQEVNFGYLYTSIVAAIALGAYAASKMKVDGKERKFIIVAQFVSGLLVIATSLVTTLYGCMALFIAHEIPRGFLNPVKDGYLQKRIPSEERATISSFCAIAPHIGGAIGLVLSGLIAEYCSISISWLFSGVILVVGSILVAKNGKE